MVLAVASTSAWYQADYVRAHKLARDALRDPISADSPAPELPYMALILSSRPDQMRGILTEGLAALDAIDADSLSRARLHSAAAGYSAQIGDLEFAAVEAQETLRIGREGRFRFFIMTGLYLVALTSWGTAPGNALAALEESIALSRRNRSRPTGEAGRLPSPPSSAPRKGTPLADCRHCRNRSPRVTARASAPRSRPRSTEVSKCSRQRATMSWQRSLAGS